VSLADTEQTVEVAPPASQISADELEGIAQHHFNWARKATVTFQSCPPARVMLIGDSVAFTLGLGLLQDEEQYGVELTVAPILGCAFGNKGQLIGTVTYAACATEFQQWQADETKYHPQAVVVEMGWRDSFDWSWDGQVVHLGEPAFDAYVEQRMELLVQELGQGGVPVLFLTVPWASPPEAADGSLPAEASPERHDLINSMLASVAAKHPGQVRVYPIDNVVSPGNHYDAIVDGQQCRLSDGLHFTPFCGELLQAEVLPLVRQMIDAHAPNPGG
jgi:hypothetical protein